MLTLIIAILSFIIGGFLIYFVLRPRLNNIQKLNEEIVKQNKDLESKNMDLDDQYTILSTAVKAITSRKEEVENNLNILQSKRDEVENSLNSLQNQAKQSADIFYQQSMENARVRLEYDLNKQEFKYTKAKEEYENEYQSTLVDCSLELSNLIDSKKEELTKLDEEIQLHSREVAAAVDAAKRAEEIKTKADFYKLQLPQIDIDEIGLLRSIEPKLRDKDILNKVIWKSYYEKPTTDLIGRVIGSGVHTGIYKITNLENQMCYVGQAVDLSARWKQHIKRGIGAEPATRNKLYPAMLAIGVENFSFEVIEECSREELDVREDYWQDYFKAKEFGYSIK